VLALFCRVNWFSLASIQFKRSPEFGATFSVKGGKKIFGKED